MNKSNCESCKYGDGYLLPCPETDCTGIDESENASKWQPVPLIATEKNARCAELMGFVEVRGALARSWYKDGEFKFTFANYSPITKIEQAIEIGRKRGLHIEFLPDAGRGFISMKIDGVMHCKNTQSDCARKIVETALGVEGC
ncbi:hypothetical protein KA005_53180 [bacterium]|nr:hypothetical protein [bacterium]